MYTIVSTYLLKKKEPEEEWGFFVDIENAEEGFYLQMHEEILEPRSGVKWTNHCSIKNLYKRIAICYQYLERICKRVYCKKL
jgi:hypothetical protein